MNNEKKFKKGDLVKHRLNGESLLVLGYDNSYYAPVDLLRCRRMNGSFEDFYECELEKTE